MTVRENAFSVVVGVGVGGFHWRQEREVVNTAWVKMFLSLHTFTSAGPFSNLASPLLVMFWA